MCNTPQPGAPKRAFTLVELLVVIGIIALLISILLPSLARARKHAQTLAGLSNLRQIGMALQMYAADNKDFLPINVGWPGIPAGTRGFAADVPETAWYLLLNPYLGSQVSSLTAMNALSPADQDSALSKVFRDPNAAMDQLYGHTAGYPGFVVHYTSNPLVIPDINRDYGGGTYLFRSYKLSQIRPTPSEVTTIFDGAQMADRNGNCNADAWQINGGGIMFGLPYGTAYRQSGDTTINDPIFPGLNTDESGGWACPPGADIRWRQLDGKSCNLLFADGHAETRKMGEVSRATICPYKP